MATVEEKIQLTVSGAENVIKAAAAMTSLADESAKTTQQLKQTEAATNSAAEAAKKASVATANEAAETKKSAAEKRKHAKETDEVTAALEKSREALSAKSKALSESTGKLFESKGAMDAAAASENAGAKATGEFGDAAAGATPKVADFGRKVAEVSNAVEVAKSALGALKNSVAMFAPVMEDAVRLRNLSKATGESVSELIALEQAMKNSGASGEMAGLVFSRLARVVEDARPGTATENAFKSLGISLRDFAGQGAMERLQTLQEAFGKITDETRKTALAMQLFGGQGQAMLPILLDKNSLAEAREQVADYAQGMEKHAESFVRVKTEINKLENAVKAGFVEALSTLEPVIRVVTATIEKIPIKWLAAAIVATSAVMAGGAVVAIAKLTRSLMEQGKIWLKTASATDVASIALGRQSAAAAAAAAANNALALSNAKVAASAQAAGATSAAAKTIAAGGVLTTAATGGVTLTKTGRAMATRSKLARATTPALIAASLGTSLLDGAVEGTSAEKPVGVLGSALTGAAMGSLAGPYGALIGGAAGLGFGIYKNYFAEQLEGLRGISQAERAAAKAARETEENIRRQTRAFEDARDPIAQIENALLAWTNTQAESRAELMRIAETEVMGISTEMKFSTTNDAGELLAEIKRRKIELEKVLADAAQGQGSAETAETATQELQAISDKIHAVETLAARQKTLREQQKSGELAVFKSQQAVELETLETNLKKKEITATAYFEKRKEMLQKLHSIEADSDTADDAEVNKNRRTAEMLRLERELTHEGKSDAGRRNLDFRPSDASVRVGLNVNSAVEQCRLRPMPQPQL